MPFRGAGINKPIKSSQPMGEGNLGNSFNVQGDGKEREEAKGALCPETAGPTVASQLTRFRLASQVSKFKVMRERLEREKNWDNFSSAAPI